MPPPSSSLSCFRAGLLVSSLLTTLAASAQVQTQSYVQTGLGFIASVTDVGALAPSGAVLHSFQKRSGSIYTPLLQINDYGQVGIGNMGSWQMRSLLNVGAGMGSLTVDVLNGGTCLGFNAARLPSTNNFYFGTNGTYNGGSLIWADPEGSLHFSTRRSSVNNLGASTGGQERWLPAT